MYNKNLFNEHWLHKCKAFGSHLKHHKFEPQDGGMTATIIDLEAGSHH